MLSLFENTELITLLHAVFLLYIGVQILVLLLCVTLIAFKGAMNDLYQFVREYWQPDHLRHNLLMLSLWMSTGLAYLTLLIVSPKITAFTLTEAFEQSPILSVYIFTALSGFLIYVIYQSGCLLRSALQVSQDLKGMRRYRKFKLALQKSRDLPWLGFWGRSAVSVTHWFSEYMVRHFVVVNMRREFLPFCLSVAGEYLMLMSIVAATFLMTYDGSMALT